MSAMVNIPHGLVPCERAAIEAGLTACGYRVVNFPHAGAVSAVWGARQGCGVKLVAENAYLDGPGGPYCALAVGGHNLSGMIPARSSERLERLGVAFKPWRETGNHILICPSRGLTSSVVRQPSGWLERTVAALRAMTDRPIRIRPHPGNWKLNPPKVPIEQDLSDAWACVIFASSVGVQALIQGVPVIHTGEYWIADEAAGSDLAEIENPPMPDRVPAFERLAASQYSLDEIASGTAFRALLEPVTC